MMGTFKSTLNVCISMKDVTVVDRGHTQQLWACMLSYVVLSWLDGTKSSRLDKVPVA